MRRVLVSACVMLTAVAGGLVGIVSPAGSATGPGGEVRVQSRAWEGWDDTFTGAIRLGCRSGLAADGVHVSFSQDGTTSPEREISTGPTCNGTLQRLGYRSDEGFHPGRAVVHVRMALVDAVTGAPRGEVTVSGSVYVRPAAKVVLSQTAGLRPDGVLAVRVRIRCDRPWANYASFVSADQRQGASFASRVVEDVPCDGTYHRRTAVLTSEEEREFRAGWVRLTGDVVLENADLELGLEAFASRAALAQ